MFKRIYLKFLVIIRYKSLRTRLGETATKLAAIKVKSLKYFYTTFIDNKFNLSALVFSLVSIGLACTFLGFAKSDINFTYYLISVTAIYSTIQLTFLLQKISLLRGQKESLMTSSVPLWKALTNFRYLCFCLEEHLRQTHNREFRKALKLDISINELFYLDMGMHDVVDEQYLNQLNNAHDHEKWQDYVLLVKIVDTLVNSIGSIFDLNTANRIYAHNNKSVNTYLRILMNEGVFDLYDEIGNIFGERKSEDELFVKELSYKKQFLELQNMVGTAKDESITSVLRRIDRLVVNQVLLPLHDNTFIIEKKLPNAFLHLLINAVCILFFGSVIPLANAFSLGSEEVTRVCGGLSVGLLLMSVVMICLTFYRENDADLFRYSQIVYQGRNDQNN